MSFAPIDHNRDAASSISDDDKRWLAFTLAGAVIASACTAGFDLAKTEVAGWLARRRDAKKAAQAAKGTS